MPRSLGIRIARSLFSLCLVLVLAGCGAGQRRDVASPFVPSAVSVVSENGPPLGMPAEGAPPLVTLSATAGPPDANSASATSTGTVRPSAPAGGAKAIALAAPVSTAPSVIVGLGPLGAGWFEHFDVVLAGGRNPDGSASWLAGSEADWGRIPDASYQSLRWPPGASTCTVAGDLDGDGLDEIVVGSGAGGQGRAYIFKSTGEGYVGFATVALSDFTAYTGGADASVFPACVDLDGDGRAEVVLGTGPQGQGFAQIWRYDATTHTFSKFSGTPYANGYVRVGWSAYNEGTDAAVHPAGGFLTGKGAGRRAQLVLGLGGRGGGWVQLWAWNGVALQPYALASNANGWLQVRWPGYSVSSDAPTWPAVGDLDGDGREDLVVGLGDLGGGWLETFRATATDLVPQAWVQVPWSAYATSGQASTRPAVGDLDGDGRADLVVGLGNRGRGWLYVTRSGSGGAGWTQVRWTSYANGAQPAAVPAIMRGRPLAVRSMQVTPAAPSVPLGATQALTATLVLDDDSTLDVSDAVTWTSSSPSVAAVTLGQVTPIATGSVTITARFGGASGSTAVTVTPARLVRIDLSPAAPTIPRGLNVALTATGIYTDGTRQDLTRQVTWASDAAAVTVAEDGTVSGAETGSAIVSASRDGVSGTVSLSVTPAILQAVTVTPSAATLPRGVAQTLRAIALFSDGTSQDVSAQATWTSSVPTCVAVSAGGVASSLAKGSSRITAAFSGMAAVANITTTDAALVSLEVSPPSASLALGLSRAFTAWGTYTDGSTADLTREVIWSCGNEHAVVSNAQGSQGLVSALTAGDTVVAARCGDVIASAALTVTPGVLQRIEITPTATSLPKGVTQSFTATGIFSDASREDITSQVTWSGDEHVAVSNAAGSYGAATAASTGTATIRATLASVEGTATVTVTPAVLQSIAVTPPVTSVARGVPLMMVATGTYSDGTHRDVSDDATWTSSAAGVVSVSPGGRASTPGLGSATVTATLAGLTASASVTVTAAELVSLEITPPLPSLPAGRFLQMTASGVYTDGSTADLTATATWTSSDACAAISNADGARGLLTALSPGASTIGAVLAGKSAAAALTVTPAVLESIDVTPVNGTLPKGLTCPLTATAIYSDGTRLDLTEQVTWASDAGVAVSNAAGTRGMASGQSTGTAGVRASLDGVSGATSITVTAAVLQSIAVTPAPHTVARGAHPQFTATGIYSDQTTADLTTAATWTSSDPSVATVSNASGSAGRASTLATGTSTVSAAFDGQTGTSLLTVTPATLSGISVTPQNRSLAKGLTLAYTATGVYSDGTSVDITNQVTWSSSAVYASISNAEGSRGVATAMIGGSTTTITATASGRSGSTSLTVTAAALQNITVSAARPLPMQRGTQCQLKAMGTWTDGSTLDVTKSATWVASDTSVLTVSNAGDFGNVRAWAPGAADVRATYGSVTGLLQVTVTDPPIQSVVVEPATAPMPVGGSRAFTARAVFADGTTADVTQQAWWATGDAAVATVSIMPKRGTVTAAGAGTCTVTATYGSTPGTCAIEAFSSPLASLSVTSSTTGALAVGLSTRFTAMGTYQDGHVIDATPFVSWSSSGPAVLSIDGQGRGVGLAAGSATVTATGDGVSASVPFTVSTMRLMSIEVSKWGDALPKGMRMLFLATGHFLDQGCDYTFDLTDKVDWSSSDTTVATTSGSTVTGRCDGTATISARLNGISGSLPLVVYPPLSYMSVTPRGYMARPPFTLQLTAIGFVTSGQGIDVTKMVTWTVSDAAAASISNDPATAGQITTRPPGSLIVRVLATDTPSGVWCDTSVQLQPALATLAITPDSPSMSAGSTITLKAIGTYADGSTGDVSTTVAWSSSDTSVATIGSSAGKYGVVYPQNGQGGITTIRVLDESGSSAATTLQVLGMTGARNFIYITTNYGFSGYRMSSADGGLVPIADYSASGGSTTCLVPSPDGRLMFAGGTGSISCYAVDAASGRVTRNYVVSSGAIYANARKFAVDPSGQYLFVLHSTGGLHVYAIHADGTLSDSGLGYAAASGSSFVTTVVAGGQTFVLLQGTVEGTGSLIALPFSATGPALGAPHSIPLISGINEIRSTDVGGTTMLYALLGTTYTANVRTYSLAADGTLALVGSGVTIPGQDTPHCLSVVNTGTPRLFVSPYNGVALYEYLCGSDGLLPLSNTPAATLSSSEVSIPDGGNAFLFKAYNSYVESWDLSQIPPLRVVQRAMSSPLGPLYGGITRIVLP